MAEEKKDELNNKLNSSTLTPEPSIEPEVYEEPPVFDVKNMEIPELPEIQMTQPEQQAQGYNEQLQALNAQLLGESEFRAEQEEAQGVPGLMQTQTDLRNRLRVIQNEANAIPLQLQQESTGRGRTVGGLRPLQTGRLRENAIQALQTSALMEAANNNLLTAQTLVDRAVNQKYDPVRERINVAQKNLQLILDSPKYSVEDKKRAQAQLEAQEARKTALAEQEANEKAVMDVATQAAQLGADAMTLQRIMESGNAENALLIATQAGLFEQPEDPIETKIIQSADGEMLLINTQTGETVKSFGKVDNIQEAEQEILTDMIRSYPDAGISLADDLRTAQDKLKNSRIYQDQVRPPMRSGGGGGGGASAPSAMPAGEGYIDKNTGKPIKLTATQTDTLTGFDNTLEAAQDALGLLMNKNGEYEINTGPIASKWHAAKKLFNKADEDLLKFEQLTAKVKAEFMKAISGAAVSEPEVRRLSAFLPDINDTEQVVESKLRNLIDETKRSKDNFLNTVNAEQRTQANSNIQTAVDNGYSPTEIIDFMASDNPDMENKIQEARNAGYSDEEILRYLNQ